MTDINKSELSTLFFSVAFLHPGCPYFQSFILLFIPNLLSPKAFLFCFLILTIKQESGDSRGLVLRTPKHMESVSYPVLSTFRKDSSGPAFLANR